MRSPSSETRQLQVRRRPSGTTWPRPAAADRPRKPRRDQLGRDGGVPSSTGTMLSMLSMAVLLRVISFAQEDRRRGGGALPRVARRHRGRDASLRRRISGDDKDQPWAVDAIEHSAQQCLALFDWAAPEVVTVEEKQVEREVGEPIRLATIERVLEVADVRHATVIRDGDLAVQHDFSPAGQQVAERGSE